MSWLQNPRKFSFSHIRLLNRFIVIKQALVLIPGNLHSSLHGQAHYPHACESYVLISFKRHKSARTCAHRGYDFVTRSGRPTYPRAENRCSKQYIDLFCKVMINNLRCFVTEFVLIFTPSGLHGYYLTFTFFDKTSNSYELNIFSCSGN